MNNVHPLAREHLKDQSKISGMPGQQIDPSLRQLQLNINYIADSAYIIYPSDENENLSEKYIDILRFESEWKKKEISKLAFLKPSNTLFISSSNAIDLLIKTFCEPKIDSICIASPTFPLYAFCAYNHLVTVIDIPLEGHDLDILNVSKILDSKTKILFIPAPNNPVGSFPKRELIFELIKKFEGVIVLDEAYIEFSDESSFVNHVNLYPNLVILRSFSKIWGHAGLRCGVTIGNEALITTLKRMLPPCFFPTITQEIINTILSKSRELILKMHLENKAEREKLMKGLKEMTSTIQVYPSQSNFILVKFNDANKMFEGLLKEGFLVKNFHPIIPNTLRISLGNKDDNRKLLTILQQNDE